MIMVSTATILDWQPQVRGNSQISFILEDRKE